MTKKRIYYVVLIFFMIGTSLGIQSARAHPPDIGIVTYSFRNWTGILDVSISHPVSDPNSHYISSVEVQKNGSTVLTETYTSQPTEDGAHYLYDIIASTNDRIQIIATCNEGGADSICVIIVGLSCVLCPEENGGDGGDGIPGYLGIWLIVGISVIIFLTVIHRKLRYNTT